MPARHEKVDGQAMAACASVSPKRKVISRKSPARSGPSSEIVVPRTPADVPEPKIPKNKRKRVSTHDITMDSAGISTAPCINAAPQAVTKRGYIRKSGNRTDNPPHAIINEESSSTASTTDVVPSLGEWDPAEYDARKVIVRLDADGEPCVAGACSRPVFQTYFFVCWRSFDPTEEEKQYAECSTFPTSHTKQSSTTDPVMIPVKSVYFINPSKYFHPSQDEYFPELIRSFPGAVWQPSRPAGARSEITRLIKSTTSGFVQESKLKHIPVLGDGIELRVSRIPNSGRGVFVTRDFHEGEVITLYFGHVFGEQERAWMQYHNMGSHCKPLQYKHSYLDGVKTAFVGMHAGQLLNQGDANTRNCEWITLETKTSKRFVAIRATRYIFPGEELYISYGKKFWDEQLASPTPVPPVQLPRRINSLRN